MENPFDKESDKRIEITPEQKEIIKRKIQDINKEGTAYLALGPNNTSNVGEGVSLDRRLEIVLKTGVLNPNLLRKTLEKEGAGEEGEITSTGYEGPDLKKKGNIYFNVVGRSAKWNYATESWEEVTIQKDSYLNDLQDEADNIALIFDIDKFKSAKEVDYQEFLESPETFNEKRAGWNWKNPPKSRTYTYNVRVDSFDRALENKIPFTKDGLPMADSGYGYVLANRIPPRFFKGLVLRPQEGKGYEDLLQKTLELMSLNSKPENMIPIYDINGNLLWPEQVSHEEIIDPKKEGDLEASV